MTAPDEETIQETGPLSPWERLPTEGPEAWEAFTTYRDIGPQRSCEAVAQQVGKGRALMLRWSRTHAWVARCETWDAEIDRVRQSEHMEAVRSMATRHVEIAHAMLEKVVARLQTLDVDSLTPHQLARFARDAVTIERLALGQPTAPDPANTEADDAAESAMAEALSHWLAEREQRAFMEGAAVAQAIEVESTVTTPADA